MVRYRYEDLPPLTDEGRARLNALAAMPSSEIDTSDIPVLTDEEFASRKVLCGYFYRPLGNARQRAI